MKSTWYNLKKKFLRIFAHVKIFKWPMFIVCEPDGYKIKGKHTLEVQSIITDGCVLARAYDGYLDGIFIPIGDSKCSHTAIYMKGYVYHALAYGVCKQTLIDFCRCDRIIVMQPKKLTKKQIQTMYEHCERNVGRPYDYNLDPHNTSKYFCHEFTASCYEDIYTIREAVCKNKLGMRNSQPTYLVDSFYKNKNFKVIYKK